MLMEICSCNKNTADKTVTITAHFVFFGEASSSLLASQMAQDIQNKWNEPHAKVVIDGTQYSVNLLLLENIEIRIWIKFGKAFNTDPTNNYVEVRNTVDDGPIKEFHT